ncbi:MAG: S41 family peptidase [Muribaculaceae bacterium]|nr:S41 family peptidase [Muribaculaceae bacterium]
MKRLLIIISLLASILPAVAFDAQARKDEFARNLQVFNAVAKELQTNYVDTLNAKEIMEYTISAMLYQVDPYTEYYPAADQDDLLTISTGRYGGIGSVIGQRDGYIFMSEPYWNSPARRAGIRHGDRLIAIDGDTLTSKSTTTEVSSRLRGPAGTELKVTVQRPYVQDSIIDIVIQREEIKVDPLPYYGVDKDGVGYMRLTTFNERAAAEVKEAVSSMLADKNLKGMILDLRGNGGGLLEGAVQVVSNFVPKGTEVLTTKGRNTSENKTYRTATRPQTTDMPLVVLTDGNSASSSEIVAGSLQDLDRAVIVGERSFGKGLVQSGRNLPYGDLMKITTARYYIPSGRLIQAIDYREREADGRPVRKPDSLTNVYHTRAGRIVRDGGGITPDVKVAQPEMNRLIYNLLNGYWVYDYATRFTARNPQAPDSTTFKVTEEMFEDFKKGIDPERFKYTVDIERGLNMLRETAQKDGYMTDSLSSQFDQLELMLKPDIDRDLNRNRDRILELIDSEISSRYWSDSEGVRREIANDEVVDEARKIILDPERYKSLLKP